MSDNLEVGASSRVIVKDKLRQNFDGKIAGMFGQWCKESTSANYIGSRAWNCTSRPDWKF